MYYFTGILFLAIAISLDGFGVGIAYGMRRIRLPLTALFIIMFCSGTVVFTSMEIGHMIRSIVSTSTTNIIGGVILVIIGFYCFWNVTRSAPGDMDDDSDQQKQFTQFKTVVKEPKHADLDASGTISTMEAIFLGIALSLDAFGAGIGAAMLGYSVLITPFIVALMSGTFVYGGMKAGIYLARFKWIKQIKYIPPILLITLGIINMY